MENIINITEKNNRLEFSDTYNPIVCGNSNYILRFNFGEQWQNCNRKAAFFVIDGNKLTVDFEGDECNVPVLPNAAFVFVSLVSGEGQKQLATTPIRIRLESTMAGGDFSEFNQLTNYLPKILGAINQIESGEVVAKNSQNAKEAEFAQRAENAKIAEYAENISNPNILINGDFRINQRGLGELSITGTNKYTSDRWQVPNANDNKVTTYADGKIKITQINGNASCQLRQALNLEESNLLGKTVTLTIKISNISGVNGGASGFGLYLSNGTNTAFKVNSLTNIYSPGIYSFTAQIPTDTEYKNVVAITFLPNATGASATYDWIKLEEGEKFTNFKMKPYFEEFSNCCKYFRNYLTNSEIDTCISTGLANSTSVLFPLNFDLSFRVVPTIKFNNVLIYDGTDKVVKTMVVSGYSKNKNNLTIQATADGLESKAYILKLNKTASSYIEFDAEIY